MTKSDLEALTTLLKRLLKSEYASDQRVKRHAKALLQPLLDTLFLS